MRATLIHSLSFLHPTKHLTRPISYTNNPTRPTKTRPVSTPLFLQPVKYSATVSELVKFQKWAKKTCDVSLRNEVKWLLEDCYENSSLVLQVLENDSLVQLRTNLENLYKLWEERVNKKRPFQYIVGCQHWRDLIISVQEGVLIPRPETELVVDLVEGLVKGNERFFGEGLWADLGTGSGALAIGIARVLAKKGKVVAVDLSPVAVAVTGYNVERYNLQDKIQIRMGSWFEPLKDVEGELVGLVSNPPYIPTADISSLQVEVGKHEPILALDGGADGMDDLLHLCDGAASMLKPGGFFVFETNGEAHCKFLVDYLGHKFEGTFCDLSIVSDFAGKQRFVTGYRVKL